jgi:heme-degrading protein
MYVAESKRLTHQGAKKMMMTAVDMANQAGIAISCAIVDAGGHMILLERMDGGRFHTVHSCTTKAVCAASNRRPTTAKGAAGQDLDVSHAIGLALAAGHGRCGRARHCLGLFATSRYVRISGRSSAQRTIASDPGDRLRRGRLRLASPATADMRTARAR